MPKVTPQPAAGRHYTALSLGAFNNLNEYVFKHQALPFDVEGKVFINKSLALTSAEISLNKLPAHGGMPFYHRHQQNEEIYIFLKGQGEFDVDGDIIPVCEGTVIRVSPEGERCWRNTSSEPLQYIVIQAKAGSYTHGTTIEDGIGTDRKVNWK